ncbi:MAG: hypothetical protein FJX76_03025 [Armatimonadetes bacterium]|nr:hypothetical protein [Armatimonadota bacterium]
MEPIGISAPCRPPATLDGLPSPERRFVDEAVLDNKFGAKNAFILSTYFAYPVHRDPDPGAFTPPPPITGPNGPKVDPSLQARTFKEIFDDVVPLAPLQLPGMSEPITVAGASKTEIRRLAEIVEAIPAWSREFLVSVREIRVSDFQAFKAEDGTVSAATSGVAEAETGRLLLNRKWLDANTRTLPAAADDSTRARAAALDLSQWQNTLLHELAHFQDRWLQKDAKEPPSKAQGSPMGNHGVWYTNYAWLSQDPAEDLAEGYAILAQRRLQALTQANR